MDLQSKNNAREALNNLKIEISSELGYYYNMKTDKIEGLAPQGNLDGMTENIKAGVEVGGMTSRKLVEMGEKALVDKYNKKFPIRSENCYMKILNYKDINYLDKIDKLQSIGVTNYKIILDRENIEEIKLIISALKIKENIL